MNRWTNTNYLEVPNNNSYTEEETNQNQNHKIVKIPSYVSILQNYLDSEFMPSDIIDDVLYESLITLKIDKSISYINIIYDKKNSIIYKDFKKLFKIKQRNNQTISNYIKFILFLKQIKMKAKNIKNTINNLELIIKFKIKIEENNSFGLDNISSEYILQHPNLYNINNKKYKDNYILTNEKYDEFNNFINDIIYTIYGNKNIEEKKTKFIK